jgi:hypothetical protein
MHEDIDYSGLFESSCYNVQLSRRTNITYHVPTRVFHFPEASLDMEHYYFSSFLHVTAPYIRLRRHPRQFYQLFASRRFGALSRAENRWLPSSEHWTVVKRILRYLKSTYNIQLNLGICKHWSR